MLPYMERYHRVRRCSSGVTLKQAVKQGSFLQEASQLVFWDTLQSEGGDGSTHCTEVRQITEGDSESTHSCERSKYRITVCVCVCVCVCVPVRVRVRLMVRG